MKIDQATLERRRLMYHVSNVLQIPFFIPGEAGVLELERWWQLSPPPFNTALPIEEH